MGEVIVNFFKDFRKEFKSIKKKEIKRQIPNLLTLSRGLAPIVIIPTILFNKLYLVIILLNIFALTDFLDGKIARKYNLVSEFGVKLDAVCDKIFAISLIIPAIINHGIFIFNFVMEIAISYTNLLSYTKGNNPRSTIIGKIKTALLSLTLILAYIPNMNNLVIFIFSHITIICQVITLIKYINTDMEMDKNKKSSS
ncbi:MAG: CDP-alcohol phosphatidyltransferase family protein [Erysipelotrichaceae bacterium]|nr:CDP-alcohol phosphatidyltransferase family protein [Erysipelotrichaceae bacterium]